MGLFPMNGEEYMYNSMPISILGGHTLHIPRGCLHAWSMSMVLHQSKIPSSDCSPYAIIGLIKPKNSSEKLEKNYLVSAGFRKGDCRSFPDEISQAQLLPNFQLGDMNWSHDLFP